MTDVKELIERLRGRYWPKYTMGEPDIQREAADALEAQAREIVELRGDRDAAERGHDAAHAACVKYQDQVDALESRLTAAERERDEIMAMAEKREGELRTRCEFLLGMLDVRESELVAARSRLAEAVALLREARVSVVNEDWILYGPEKPRPQNCLLDRIGAFLAKLEAKP